MSQAIQPTNGRRRCWTWCALAALLLAGLLFRGPLLRGAARLLIADDGRPAGEDLLVLSCQRSIDRASDLYHAGLTSRLHFIEEPASRLVSMGLRPSWGSRCVGQWVRRGVPPSSISRIEGVSEGPWQDARAVRRWLLEQPSAKIVVLCDRFNSGAIRSAFALILEAEQMQRVGFWCPRDPRFDENDWWKSHDGRREFVVALFAQAYLRLHGEDAPQPAARFDPDAYERALE